MIDSDAILARANAATKGTWYANRNDLAGGWSIGTGWGPASINPDYGDIADLADGTNAFFMSNARQDIPELVSEVERLRSAIREIAAAGRSSVYLYPVELEQAIDRAAVLIGEEPPSQGFMKHEGTLPDD